MLPRRGKGGQGDRRTERETKRSETAAGLNAMLIRLTVGFPQQNLIACPGANALDRGGSGNVDAGVCP